MVLLYLNLCFALLLFIAFTSLFYFIPDVFDYSLIIFPTDSTGATLYPPILRPKGTCIFCFLSGLSYYHLYYNNTIILAKVDTYLLFHIFLFIGVFNYTVLATYFMWQDYSE